MTTEEKYRWILSNHLPAAAVPWVYDYLNRHRVHFHITRERRSKLGDYRWPQGEQHPFHEISVNGDLNPYFFLWVFLHEAAHLETHLKHTSVQPHGHEWQEEYARLLSFHVGLFPEEAQSLITRYVRRIPLSRSMGRQVEDTLRHFDSDYNPECHVLRLNDLAPGDRFRLKNKPDLLFEVLEHRRTRWLCREVGGSRRYYVNGAAEIERA